MTAASVAIAAVAIVSSAMLLATVTGDLTRSVLGA